MVFFSDALVLLAALCYLASSTAFVVYLAGLARPALGVATRLVAGGALLHAVHIVLASMVTRICPVRGLHFALSLVSVLACGAFLVARRRYRVDVVGAFVAPLALSFLLASWFVPSEPSKGIKNAVLPLHVAANLLGVALFTLAFAAAVAYLLQDSQLKKKRVAGLFQRLPPLEALDRAEHGFLLAGFPLLTLGILTGTLWAGHVEAGNARDIARSAFGYVSWLQFAAVLLLRAGWGWRGRRAAYGTITGFGFTLLVLVVYLVRDIGTGVSRTEHP
jgi:ABC-type uncharacterized transport system permease subunit